MYIYIVTERSRKRDIEKKRERVREREIKKEIEIERNVVEMYLLLINI